MNNPTDIFTCERAFFERYDAALRFPVEPVSAISALFMSVIVFFGPPKIPTFLRNHVPIEFWLAQAGTFLNGIESFIFHSVHPNDYNHYGVNPRMLDGMALSVMSIFTALLLVKSEHRILGSRIALVYLFFVAWSNDSLTYFVLDDWTSGLFAMTVQFPLMGVFYAYSVLTVLFAFDWHEVYPTLLVLGIAFLSCLIDRFACDNIDALSFFHLFWHIFGTYGNLLLMTLGLKFRGYDLKGRWWPEVVKEPTSYSRV